MARYVPEDRQNEQSELCENPRRGGKMMNLSKSRFMAGLQCPKYLWWCMHEPDAPELQPDPARQAIFDQGTRIGELAREQIPGGVFIDVPHYMTREWANATRQAIDDGAEIIYEAAFLKEGLFAAVDILVLEPDGWRIIEVKSSLDVKEVHLFDTAFQVHLAELAGLDVIGAELMHLNRACTHPNLSNLFLRDDITEKSCGHLVAAVWQEIDFLRGQMDGPLPSIDIGPRCDAPHECPFKTRCWSFLPNNPVTSLAGVKWETRWQLLSKGIETIAGIPDDVQLGEVANRQRRAIESGSLVIDPGLGEALAEYEFPITFLDFETVWPAIPAWAGCHPYGQVAVQFSCHVMDEDGSIDHHEWLPEGTGDPRPELALRLLDSCGDSGTVLAWNASFEMQRIEDLARHLPDLASRLEELHGRVRDLLTLVRRHVYHPDFNGSFSLKAVLPALLPGESYDDLAIANGGAASQVLEAFLLHGDTCGRDVEEIRTDLLRYCEKDTQALVLLFRELVRLG